MLSSLTRRQKALIYGAIAFYFGNAILLLLADHYGFLHAFVTYWIVPMGLVGNAFWLWLTFRLAGKITRG